jgi:hypothetical protein
VYGRTAGEGRARLAHGGRLVDCPDAAIRNRSNRWSGDGVESGKEDRADPFAPRWQRRLRRRRRRQRQRQRQRQLSDAGPTLGRQGELPARLSALGSPPLSLAPPGRGQKRLHEFNALVWRAPSPSSCAPFAHSCLVELLRGITAGTAPHPHLHQDHTAHTAHTDHTDHKDGRTHRVLLHFSFFSTFHKEIFIPSPVGGTRSSMSAPLSPRSRSLDPSRPSVLIAAAAPGVI